jgi:hypothetical protein
MQFIRGLALAGALAGMSVSVYGGSFVTPGQYANAPGSSGNTFPFSQEFSRYQQIIPSSEFSVPLMLTGIAFRPSVLFLNPTDTNFDVQIDLSVTSVAPDALNSVFANNLGPSVTTVYQGNKHVVLSGTVLPNGTSLFELTFPFSAPFSYNPAAGNLLFDVRTGTNAGKDFLTGMDVFNTVNGFSPGRVYGNSSDPGGTVGSIGLIAQLSFQDAGTSGVPEPGTIWMTGTAVAGWVLLRRRGERGPR